MHSQTFVTVLLAVLELVYFAIMSRLLSKEDFGYFALITAVTLILNSLTDAGLGASVIQKKEVSPKFVSTAFSMSVISGIFFALVLFFGAPLFSDLMIASGKLTAAFRLMSVTLVIQGIANIYNATYIRRLHFMKLGLLKATAYFLSAVLGIIGALAGYGYYSILIAVIANQLFFMIIIVALNRKAKLRFSICRQYVKEIFGFGGLLTLSEIIRRITDQLDRIIVARMLSVSAVGVINRPSGFIASLSSNINGIFDTILFPILSQVQDDNAKIVDAFKKSTGLITLFSSFLAGFLVLGSKYLIDIFFGSQWESILDLMIIFSLVIFFTGYSRVCDCFFRSLGIMKSFCFMRVFNCAATVSLIVAGCMYGVEGVAWSKLVSNIVECGIKYFMLRRHIRFRQLEYWSGIFSNTRISLAIFGGCFLLMIFTPGGTYYSVFVYMAAIIAAAVCRPDLFGPLFRQHIFARYLKKLPFLRG